MHYRQASTMTGHDKLRERLLRTAGVRHPAFNPSAKPLRFSTSDYPKSRRGRTSVVAIDCEMVMTGRESVLARVSIVNYWGYPLLDIFVQPDAPITRYCSKWSGITPAVLRRARSEGNLWTTDAAIRRVKEMVEGTLLVGHALSNDLRVLRLDHKNRVDTQKFDFYLLVESLGTQVGLKRAIKHYFDIDIQTTSRLGHSSVEDAQAAMLLYRFAEERKAEIRRKEALMNERTAKLYEWLKD